MPTARRGQGEGSIYKRRDGIWTAQIDLGSDGDKRRRKFIYGTTKREVQDKLGAVMHDHRLGIALPTRDQSLGTFLDEWLESGRSSIRASTYTSFEGTVRLHIKPTLGNVRLQKLTPQQISALLAQKQDRLSPRSSHYVLIVLRIALNRALRWGLVGRNVASLVPPPRASRKLVNVLTPEQARALLHAARGDRMEALYAVAISLGLRQGEALGLRWSDVDLERRELHVSQALHRVTGGGLQLGPTKNDGSIRVISMPTSIAESLRQHGAHKPEERLRAGKNWVESGLVFTTTTGAPT